MNDLTLIAAFTPDRLAISLPPLLDGVAFFCDVELEFDSASYRHVTVRIMLTPYLPLNTAGDLAEDAKDHVVEQAVRFIVGLEMMPRKKRLLLDTLLSHPMEVARIIHQQPHLNGDGEGILEVMNFKWDGEDWIRRHARG